MDVDRAKRDALILENLGLAGELANRWEGRIEGLERDDIFQECVVALTRAADRWQAGRLKFSTWAWVCMERNLRRVRDNAGLVRVPYYLAPLVERVRRIVAAGGDEFTAIAELPASKLRKRLVRFALHSRPGELIDDVAGLPAVED